MSDERSSEKNAPTGGTHQYRVQRRVRLAQEVDTVHTRIESTLEARKAKEKNESEPWYFAHM